MSRKQASVKNAGIKARSNVERKLSHRAMPILLRRTLFIQEVVQAHSHPTVLMPPEVNEIFPARPIVNQIEDECPHDRPRCLTCRLIAGLCFQSSSWARKMISSTGQNGVAGNGHRWLWVRRH
jgi:hypothetical protein